MHLQIRCINNGLPNADRNHISRFGKPECTEISVDMREEDVPDLERVFGGKRNTLADIPLGVDDGCRARRLSPIGQEACDRHGR